ncbi:hypothetical protein [Novipirellula artificiosorum]|uniref:Bacterial membrane protein YfhO n=1 Tax=Novipirellula artificiosorum TaxID=2528016 RepID=A0A5C6E3J6_9BACT|nr:hypothetical protein [Novipirellula artificiosorum]TWU42006.1 hypothetical protein Poly41_03020 [Novipirellula artificiosorum]
MNWRCRVDHGVGPAVALLLFATALLGVDRLAFRDVSHFYTPLYDYVAERTGLDWIPLWNPLDQTGIPLMGETTTAVLYPVRWLVFALPLPTEVALSWYVVVHLGLAVLAARYAAGRCGVTSTSASLAGILYAFCGSVLYLYTNPPFLVGAAWAPVVLSTLVVGGYDSMRKRVRIASVAMAMMILGGDPQTALHVVITATIVGAARWSAKRTLCNFRLLVLPIFLSCVVAATLSFPQIAASLSWSRQSQRVVDDDTGHWLAPPAVDSRRERAYRFSLPPWHVLELLTPNAFGSMLPQNHRLSTLIPGDGRTWTPSIYMSMLVVIAAISRMLSRRKPQIDLWTGIAFGACAVSMGHFGVVWILQNMTGKMMHVDSAAGGLYWWLYHFFPGYDSLRYPAKWLPIMAIAISMLTARWVDALQRTDWKSIRNSMVAVAVGLGMGLAAIMVLRIRPSLITSHLASLPADAFWGPLDIDAGLADVSRSLSHSLFFLGCIAAVFYVWSKERWNRRQLIFGLTVIIAVDLGVFGSSIIAKVNRSEESLLLTGSKPEIPARTFAMRTRSAAGWPRHWRDTPSEDRLLEVEASMRAASFGRWHLVDRQPVFNNMTSIRSVSMALFWKAASNVTESMNSLEREQFWNAVRNWLRINRIIHVADDDVQIARDGKAYSMTRVSDSVKPQQRPWTPFQWSPSRRTLSERNTTLQDFESLLRSLVSQNDGPLPETIIDVRVSEPDRASVFVSCDQACLLQRSVYQDGNWTATLTKPEGGPSKRVIVEKIDFLKQGVEIPPGRWLVMFRYSPWWLWPSVSIALAGWFAIACQRWARF